MLTDIKHKLNDLLMIDSLGKNKRMKKAQGILVIDSSGVKPNAT